MESGMVMFLVIVAEEVEENASLDIGGSDARFELHLERTNSLLHRHFRLRGTACQGLGTMTTCRESKLMRDPE